MHLLGSNLHAVLHVVDKSPAVREACASRGRRRARLSGESSLSQQRPRLLLKPRFLLVLGSPHFRAVVGGRCGRRSRRGGQEGAQAGAGSRATLAALIHHVVLHPTACRQILPPPQHCAQPCPDAQPRSACCCALANCSSTRRGRVKETRQVGLDDHVLLLLSGKHAEEAQDPLDPPRRPCTSRCKRQRVCAHHSRAPQLPQHARKRAARARSPGNAHLRQTLNAAARGFPSEMRGGTLARMCPVLPTVPPLPRTRLLLARCAA